MVRCSPTLKLRCAKYAYAKATVRDARLLTKQGRMNKIADCVYRSTLRQFSTYFRKSLNGAMHAFAEATACEVPCGLCPPKHALGSFNLAFLKLLRLVRSTPSLKATACEGGERGIRTLDTGLSPYASLAGKCLRPLGQLSARGRNDTRLRPKNQTKLVIRCIKTEGLVQNSYREFHILFIDNDGDLDLRCGDHLNINAFFG